MSAAKGRSVWLSCPGFEPLARQTSAELPSASVACTSAPCSSSSRSASTLPWLAASASGVQPAPFFSSGRAPRARQSCTAPSRPWMHATWSGGFFRASDAWTAAASRSKSSDRTSSLPGAAAAACVQVPPAARPGVVGTLSLAQAATLAPIESSSSTAAGWPAPAATISAVSPCSPTASTAKPESTSEVMADTLPSRAASSSCFTCSSAALPGCGTACRIKPSTTEAAPTTASSISG